MSPVVHEPTSVVTEKRHQLGMTDGLKLARPCRFCDFEFPGATIHYESDFMLCPNHLMGWVIGSLTPEQQASLPPEVEASAANGICCLCNNSAQAVIHDLTYDERPTAVIDWNVCKHHLREWVLRTLTPEEVTRIQDVAGGETFLIRYPFYDEEGYAMQPVK
jgi:hypothetical protein